MRSPQRNAVAAAVAALALLVTGCSSDSPSAAGPSASTDPNASTDASASPLASDLAPTPTPTSPIYGYRFEGTHLGYAVVGVRCESEQLLAAYDRVNGNQGVWTFNTDGTLRFVHYENVDGFESSGTGTWRFEPETATIPTAIVGQASGNRANRAGGSAGAGPISGDFRFEVTTLYDDYALCEQAWKTVHVAPSPSASS